MKRRGFTLIELMVVIAIIIILAAIAIPNYLTMTARAKKSRVASDFASIATALETYKTDWGTYPAAAVGPIGGTSTPGTGYLELTGTSTTGSFNNKSTPNTTAAGDKSPIVYMTTNILTSMVNPYSNAAGDEYKYSGNVDHWLLTATTVAGGTTNGYLSRTDATPTLAGPSALPTVTASGS